jgi:hypothetical protein
MSDEAAKAYVRKIVADNDLVIGVWREPAARFGVGIHPIKGRRLLVEAVAVHASLNVRLGAVPCVDREQAVAAERVFGNKPN